MNPDQEAEMQEALEKALISIDDLTRQVRILRNRASEEDTRKRLFRTATIVSLLVLGAMTWWGFDTVIHRIESLTCLVMN